MTGTGLQGKDKSSPGQTETQVVSASHRPLSSASVPCLPCALLAIPLTEAHISSVPFPSLSPLPASDSLWTPTADRGTHHTILASIKGQAMPQVSPEMPAAKWYPSI